MRAGYSAPPDNPLAVPEGFCDNPTHGFGGNMIESEVLEIFRQTGALLEGHFLLRSGLHSSRYFQCAQVLQWPRHAERLCRALADRCARDAQAVISPAMGGLFVGHEVARARGCRHIFAEKNAAGTLELRRNFSIARGERFLVVEDVVTRGGRVLETMQIVRAHGGEVVGVGALVDRSGGTVDFQVPFGYLLRLQVETFEAEQCPFCREGVPLVKPGS